MSARELTCAAGDEGAKLFVSVLACEFFAEKTACRGSSYQLGSDLCPERHVSVIDQLGGDMQERNLLEDLVAVSPGMEIWWDSSPVIFGNWCEKMLAKADDADKDNLKRQFARMYDTSATPWASCSAASPPTRPSRWPRSRTTRRAGRRSPRRSSPTTPASTPKASSGCSTKRSSGRAPTCSSPSLRRQGTKRASSPARSTRAAPSTEKPCWRRPSRSTPSTPT